MLLLGVMVERQELKTVKCCVKHITELKVINKIKRPSNYILGGLFYAYFNNFI